MKPDSPDFLELCAELVDELSYHADEHSVDELIARARAALATHPPGPVAPIPVSERLPGPEDCNAEGKCWMFGNVEGDWRLISMINPGVPKLKYCFSHWLPANALPFPENND